MFVIFGLLYNFDQDITRSNRKLKFNNSNNILTVFDLGDEL